MKTRITERLLAYLWQRRVVDHLVTDAGDQLNVIHPGRRSIVSGCDFQDANFAINGELITGNVELHVKSSQWYGHGHNRDPKYNSVALHIVWRHDAPSGIRLQNGKLIPTSALNSVFESSSEGLSGPDTLTCCPSTLCPKAGSSSDTETLNKLLDEAGERRFAAKAASFMQAMGQAKPEQVLFRGIARAVGYSQNADPCEKMADKLRWDVLEDAASRSPLATRALILGTAGLLPSQRPGLQLEQVELRTIKRLEAVWHSDGIPEAMRSADWCFFRVRPENFPSRRLAALSSLLARYRRRGLLRTVLQLVRQAPIGAEHSWLEKKLTVVEPGYWSNHFDFGLSMRSSALLGRDKVSAIVINAVLPFVSAWGKLNSDRDLKKKATETYRCYPAPGNNELTRYMVQQLSIKPGTRLSARRQQGLIHIFRTYCRSRDCRQCLLSVMQS